MITVIMAGGRGTRISELFPDIPKPLIPIQNTPVLKREIIGLRDQGFTEIILTVSYMASRIQDYFGDGSWLGVKITYFVEKAPLGNAGALFFLRDRLGDSPFLLLNADAVFDVDFNRMLSFHKAHRAKVTLFTHPNSHPFDSGLIISAYDGSVEQWLTKEDRRPEWYKNRVNAGLHIIDPAVLDSVDVCPNLIGTIDPHTGKAVKVDLDRQILKPLCGTHTMFCYDSPEYVKDMGTPERFRQVEQDYAAGIVTGRNLKNPQRAIFLDRDGTLNHYVGFLRSPSELELIEGAAEAVKKINESGFLAIVITNQPVIARGEVTVDQLTLIHNKLETLLGFWGAYIDGLYYCPHHPDKGFEGEVAELKIDCVCRKPKPGLLLKAAEDFNIRLDSSWMIGDGKNDVLAGKNAGTHTVFITAEKRKGVSGTKGRKEENIDADLVCTSLLDAVNQIL